MSRFSLKFLKLHSQFISFKPKLLPISSFEKRELIKTAFIFYLFCLQNLQELFWYLTNNRCCSTFTSRYMINLSTEYGWDWCHTKYHQTKNVEEVQYLAKKLKRVVFGILHLSINMMFIWTNIYKLYGLKSILYIVQENISSAHY